MNHIDVTYEVYSSRYHIDQVFRRLSKIKETAFDTETKGLYSKEQRKQAVDYLKNDDLPIDEKRIALQVAANSGLSFPSLVEVTHFVFGLSNHHSIVLICTDHQTELYIWKKIRKLKNTLFFIHNTLFDLKLMYHRIHCLPHKYEDTALFVKCFINNVEVWKSKVGLKDLMGSYYLPFWSLMEEYEPDNLRDPEFLLYAAIDGAATFRLWEEIQEHLNKGE